MPPTVSWAFLVLLLAVFCIITVSNADLETNGDSAAVVNSFSEDDQSLVVRDEIDVDTENEAAEEFSLTSSELLDSLNEENNISDRDAEVDSVYVKSFLKGDGSKQLYVSNLLSKMNPVPGTSVQKASSSSSSSINKKDILLLCTLNGEIHAVLPDKGNPNNNKLLWSSNIGKPTVQSYQLSNTMKTGTIILGNDGNLYVYTADNGLQKFPFSIPDMVEMSPVYQTIENVNTQNKLVIVGEKTSSIYEFNALNGSLVSVVSSKEGMTRSAHKNQNQDDLSFCLGRNDYFIRAFDQDTGNEIWNFTYGTFSLAASSFEQITGSVDDSQKNNMIDLYNLENHVDFNNTKMLKKFYDSGVVAAFGIDQQKLRSSESNSKKLLELPSSPMNPETKAVSSIVKKPTNSETAVTIPDKVNKVPKELDETALIHLIKHDEDAEHPFQQDVCNLPYISENVFLSTSASSTSIDIDFIEEGNHKVTNLVTDIVKKSPPEEETVSVSYELSSHTYMVILVINIAIIMSLLLFISYNKFLRISKKSSAADNSVAEFFDDKMHFVGQLSIDTDKVKGTGCHGTMVFEGLLDKRPVAVKRILKSFYSTASREIEILIKSDGHPNVVRYYAKEESRDFIFLALELCHSTLDQAVDTVNSRNEAKNLLIRKVPVPSNSTVLFLKQITNALRHIHSLYIVHCDIKPQNILVTKNERDNEDNDSFTFVGDLYIPKLSDMGLSKRVSDNQSSFGASLIANRAKVEISQSDIKPGIGTFGWRAPELLNKTGGQRNKVSTPTSSSSSRSSDAAEGSSIQHRLSRKVDVFSLGCIFYYTLDQGNHPYGELYERENNIINDNPLNLRRIKHIPEAYHLLQRMLAFNPAERPSLDVCLHHPLLWDCDTKINFLTDVSDRIEDESINSPLVEEFESCYIKVMNNQAWDNRLDPALLNDVNENSKYRKYNFKSLKDLLRLIRNKYSHYRALSKSLQELLSPVPEGFLSYFLHPTRYPKLLMVCYDFILKTCAHEAHFYKYLGSTVVKLYQLQSREWFLKAHNLSYVSERSYYATANEWVQQKSNVDASWNNHANKLTSVKYKTSLCKPFERSAGQVCKIGKKCNFAHSIVELRQYPPNYGSDQMIPSSLLVAPFMKMSDTFVIKK